MKNPYTCCIFDLDGTIINTIHALTHTTNLVLAHFGLGPLTEEQMKLMVGDGYRKQIERSLSACKEGAMAYYEEAAALYPRLFQENCLYHLEAYPGMAELLERMKAAGMRLAVLTHYAGENYGFKKIYQKIGDKLGVPAYYHEDGFML